MGVSKKVHLMRRAGLYIFAVLTLGWAALASLYSPAFPEPIRGPLTAAILVAAILSLRGSPAQGFGRAAAVVLLTLVFLGWYLLVPSNGRDWAPEVSQVPWAEIDGSHVIIHNVRNFRYRNEQDLDRNYETRSYSLEDLSGVDFAVSYWSGDNIAHVMTSFSFEDRDFIAFSIETRRERFEQYSAIKGFFRNYELIYIAGDEKDLFGVRTNHRNPNERVYLLRSRIPLRNAKKLFLQYLKEMNELRDNPSFYNTLTTNCTTQVLRNAQAYSETARYSWHILLSGHVPELLYQSGKLTRGLSLDELMERGLINKRSREAENRADYSRHIREGVPKPDALED